MTRILIFVLALMLMPDAAAGQQGTSPLTAAPGKSAGSFVDVTAAKGLNFRYLSSHTSRKYLLETMGPGVALFDYDNDGRLDIFLVNGASLDDPTP
ncbi:MAG TPA: hypothetical protein VGL91_10445, partial [Acidobacteriota bacterium]